MLAMLSEKLAEEGRQGVLLLEQDLTCLDLYGTIHGLSLIHICRSSKTEAAAWS